MFRKTGRQLGKRTILKDHTTRVISLLVRSLLTPLLVEKLADDGRDHKLHEGGFGFYVGGTSSFYNAISSGSATDVLLSYSLMFQPSWEWNKGGKLPGAFGGTGSNAFGCSGGRQEGRDTCFGARLMWRADGKGELYTYLPLTDANKDAQMQVPGTILNDDYGFSVGRGAFTFTAGEWITVAEVRVLTRLSPYFKHDRRKHQTARTCSGPGWTTITRLK